jgi:hypothetical protein
MRTALFVVAAAVGAAIVVPVRAQSAVPLADVTLVAEKASSFDAIAGAHKNGTNGNRNGNQNGNKGYYGYYGYYGFYGYYGYVREAPQGMADAIGDVGASDDSSLGEVNIR